MKFRYIIVSDWGEHPLGTDSLEVALDYARTQEWRVIDTATNEHMIVDDGGQWLRTDIKYATETQL